MRTFKGLTFLFLLLAATGGQARAAGIAVDRIQATGLGDYAGKALSVYYVSARESGIGFNGQVPKVRAIKSMPVRVLVNSAGEATIPRATVSRSGPEVFNYVVFVAHSASQASPFVRNPDNTCPLDPRVSLTEARCATAGAGEFAYDHLWFVNLTSLQNMSGAAEGQGTIALDFQNDL